jgi:transposase
VVCFRSAFRVLVAVSEGPLLLTVTSAVCSSLGESLRSRRTILRAIVAANPTSRGRIRDLGGNFNEVF